MGRKGSTQLESQESEPDSLEIKECQGKSVVGVGLGALGFQLTHTSHTQR